VLQLQILLYKYITWFNYEEISRHGIKLFYETCWECTKWTNLFSCIEGWRHLRMWLTIADRGRPSAHFSPCSYCITRYFCSSVLLQWPHLLHEYNMSWTVCLTHKLLVPDELLNGSTNPLATLWTERNFCSSRGTREKSAFIIVRNCSTTY